jgi:predicted nucleic acid-binding protein
MARRKGVKKEIFWDAVGIIAVVDNDDSLHEQAIAVRDKLFQEGVKFVTTDNVLVEVANGSSNNKIIISSLILWSLSFGL